MTSKDIRTIAGDAQLQALTAKSALEHLVSLVVSDELEVGTEEGLDAFATYAKGIESHLTDVSDALGKLAHAKDQEPTDDGPTEGHKAALPVSLDLLDRATESEHELQLLSSFACIAASEKASTSEESGCCDAVSMMCERAADVIRQLVDVCSGINMAAR